MYYGKKAYGFAGNHHLASAWLQESVVRLFTQWLKVLFMYQINVMRILWYAINSAVAQTSGDKSSDSSVCMCVQVSACTNPEGCCAC